MDLLEKYLDAKAKYHTLRYFYLNKSLVLRKCLHDEFYKSHRKLFIIMDIIFILALACNIGAHSITNIIVIKNNSTITFTEANPIQAAANNWMYNPSTLNTYIMALSTIFIYTALIIGYIYSRMYCFNEYYFLMLYVSVICLLVGFSYDFIHDLSLLIGRWMI